MMLDSFPLRLPVTFKTFDPALSIYTGCHKYVPIAGFPNRRKSGMSFLIDNFCFDEQYNSRFTI